MKLSDLPSRVVESDLFPYNLSHLRAVFNPKRRDDLRPDMLKFVDREVELFYAGTNSDNCPYPGEVTFMLRAADHMDADWSGWWVPLTDLDVIDA